MLGGPCMHDQGRPAMFYLDPILYSLSPRDQVEYFQMVNMLACSDGRNKRNLGMSTFVQHLKMIHGFVCRGDSQDVLRGIVCGIEFGDQTMLINTRRLKKLMFRSKSCMNGCFQKLGCTVCRSVKDMNAMFEQMAPGIEPQGIATRQWCVRKSGSDTSVSFRPNTSVTVVEDVLVEKPIQPPTVGGVLTHTPIMLDIPALLNHTGTFSGFGAGEIPPLRGN